MTPFERRTRRAQSRLDAVGADCLVLSPGRDCYYLTGVDGEQSDRLQLFCLPADGEPTFVVPRLEADPVRTATWVDDVRTWGDDTGPDPVLDSVLDGTPTSVSFHIPPDWVLGETFEEFQSAYAPAYFEDVSYVADSSQRWRDDPPTVDSREEAMQVLTHPGLWAPSDADFEGRVEQAIVASCRTTQETTRAEFLDGGSD